MGYRNQAIKPLELNALIRFYTDKAYVIGEIKSGLTYRIKKRIYQLNDLLPAKFIQISSSEIINFDYVDHLELVKNGLIKIVLKNQEATYVSRRFVSNIKRRLGL